MAAPLPFLSTPMAVEQNWIDYNGHMNMAYYNVLFDRCADQAFERFGIGPSYAESRSLTIYTAEIHVCYVRELHLGDQVRCSFHLVDHDEKRIHVYQELVHLEGWLAATAEVLALHIDMSGPKVAAMPDDVMAKVKAMHGEHAALPAPERIGRSIGIKRKG